MSPLTRVSRPRLLVSAQIHLLDPEGGVVQDLWSSKRLTVEVLLDSGAAECVRLPQVPVGLLTCRTPPPVTPTEPRPCLAHTCPLGACPPFLQVPKDAVPVRIEFQLTTAPLEITLDVEKGCLDSDDAKRLLGLSPHAEVR